MNSNNKSFFMQKAFKYIVTIYLIFAFVVLAFIILFYENKPKEAPTWLPQQEQVDLNIVETNENLRVFMLTGIDGKTYWLCSLDVTNRTLIVLDQLVFSINNPNNNFFETAKTNLLGKNLLIKDRL